MASNATALVVPTPIRGPDLAGMEDIRPIRPPVELPGEGGWLGWVLLATAAAALLTWWAWRRWRRGRPEGTDTPPPVPPHVRARRRLEEALAHLADARQFCFLVSQALRTYLEERFHLRAPERTTEEFLIEMQSSSHLLPDQKASLADFLQRCDLVKFARFEPTEAALRELHESALRLVDETRFEPVPAGEAAVSPATPPGTPPPLPGNGR